MKQKTYAQQFITQFLTLFVKSSPVCYTSMPESCQNTTVSAAILCSAICISDVTNKERMSDENVKHYHKPTFVSSALYW